MNSFHTARTFAARTGILLLLIIVGGMVPTSAAANGTAGTADTEGAANAAVDGIDAVTNAAQHFLSEQTRGLGEKVTVTVRPSMADLPPCAAPQPFLPGQGQPRLGRVTVGVRCGDGKVRYLQARVTAYGHYWVAGQRIAAGTRITAAMLQARDGELDRLPATTVFDRTTAIGQVATRTLTEGSVLQTTQLRAPNLVHRRQPVTVEALGSGFRVTRQGKALQDGALGDTVRVRMADRSVLSGVVSGDDQVRVTF